MRNGSGSGAPQRRKAKPRAHTKRQKRTRSVHHERSAAARGSQHLVLAGGAARQPRGVVLPGRLDTCLALRNALHRELTRLYGAAWYDNLAAGLDRGALERIADAKRKIAPGGGTVTPSKMVARLSFGFWVSLLGSGGRLDAAGRRANYEMTLWRPALRRAFPYRTPLTRIQAYQPLNALRKLRNRIAHHEPIFARPLLEDHERIVEVTGWISPGARTWIDRHSRVPLLLAASDDEAGVHF